MTRKEKKKEYDKIHYAKNKERKAKHHHEYYLNNKKRLLEYTKEWRTNNPEKVQVNEKTAKLKGSKKKSFLKFKNDNPQYIKEYMRYKYKNDINHKLGMVLRARVLSALKGNIKNSSSIELLACTIEFYILYLESLFKPEMTWLNYGVIWEIDHIKPCSSFDLTNIEQQKLCFHYTNTQPLFKTTEIAKSFGYLNEIGNRDKSDN